jgi:hypothetical protein
VVGSGAKADLALTIGVVRTGVESAAAAIGAAVTIDAVVIVPGLTALLKSISTS